MESARTLARLSRSVFSTANYRSILATGHSARLERDLSAAARLLMPKASPSRKEAVNQMWAWLVANRRDDATFRAAFMSRSDNNPVLPTGSDFVFEMRTGRSIVDFACLRAGQEEGLEIKSTFDSATRIASQVHSYRRVLPRVSLVGDARDAERMEALAIRYQTGLLLMDGSGRDWSLYRVMQAPVVVEGLSPAALVQTLRLAELSTLTGRLGLRLPRTTRAQMYPEVTKCVQGIDVEALVTATFQLVAERRSLSARQLTREVAAPLRSIVATIDPPQAQLSHLAAWLNAEV